MKKLIAIVLITFAGVLVLASFLNATIENRDHQSRRYVFTRGFDSDEFDREMDTMNETFSSELRDAGRELGSFGRELGSVGRELGSVGRELGHTFGSIGRDMGRVGRGIGGEFAYVGRSIGQAFSEVARDIADGFRDTFN